MRALAARRARAHPVDKLGGREPQPGARATRGLLVRARPEPDADVAGAVPCRFTLPDGKTHVRRFAPTVR